MKGGATSSVPDGRAANQHRRNLSETFHGFLRGTTSNVSETHH